MCPRCGQNAPVVYRGIVAYCTACNAPRLPLTASSLHAAGQPQKIGSVLARAVGWLVVGGGLSLALAVALLANVIFATPYAWLIGFAPVAAISLVVGTLLLRGATHLGTRGNVVEKDARAQAVFGLATHRGGVLTAFDVADALSISPGEADALLTALAKERSDEVTLDVDADGRVKYRFFAQSRVRVDPDVVNSPNREAWERLEREERERETQPRGKAKV